MKKSLYFLLGLFVLASCATGIKISESSRQNIISGRQGQLAKTIFTFKIENSANRNIEVKELLVKIDDQYYKIPFDLMSSSNKTLKSMPANQTITVVGKYNSDKAKKAECNKNSAAILRYSSKGKVKELLIEKIIILPDKRLR